MPLHDRVRASYTQTHHNRVAEAVVIIITVTSFSYIGTKRTKRREKKRKKYQKELVVG